MGEVERSPHGELMDGGSPLCQQESPATDTSVITLQRPDHQFCHKRRRKLRLLRERLGLLGNLVPAASVLGGSRVSRTRRAPMQLAPTAGTNPIKKEKPRHAKHEAGLIITSDLCPVRTGPMYEALPRSQSFRYWLDAVWSDQIALPNRAFAFRLKLECC